MDFFDELMADLSEDSAPPKFTKDEFIKESQEVLNKIQRLYFSCWINKPIEDEELPDAAQCEICRGCGFFGDNNDRDCVKDSEAGECYERVFDNDMLADFMENDIILGSQLMELCDAEIVEETEK